MTSSIAMISRTRVMLLLAICGLLASWSAGRLTVADERPRDLMSGSKISRPLVAASLTVGESLPTWNDSTSRNALIEFVERVTREGTADFIPPAERIAVFDNDGTLWPENPLPFQIAYAIHSLRKQIVKRPELADEPFVKATLRGDLGALTADSNRGVFQLIAATHAGMTTTEFDELVEEWFRTTKHPRFGKRYDECVYQPMLEVLEYLRAHQFKTYIVSGGGVDFMRVWAERVYGIPPEQVIGSHVRTQFEMREGVPVLVKTAGNVVVNDKEGKPVSIDEFIGRRPVMCFGNSDGDKAMLEYTTIGNRRPSFGLIVHHTDGAREYAYDDKPKSSGRLAEALADAPQRGWIVVDMKKDWKRVFAFDKDAE